MPSQSRSSVQRTHSLPVHTSPQTMLMFQQQGVTGGAASAPYLSPTPPLYPPPRSTTAASVHILEVNELKSGRLFVQMCPRREPRCAPVNLGLHACIFCSLSSGPVSWPCRFIWNAAVVCSSGSRTEDIYQADLCSQISLVSDSGSSVQHE